MRRAWWLAGAPLVAALAWMALRPSAPVARAPVAEAVPAHAPAAHHAREVPTESAPERVLPAPAPKDEEALARVRAAAQDPSGRGTELLARSLEDEHDDMARLEAIDALVERRHIASLPRLLTLDPAAEPELGPTIIAALGALGREAPDARTRDATLARLVALLAAEKERRGADSAGNVVSIIEALGVLRHPGGAPVLERELALPEHDAANRTAIVQALGQIGQRSSLVPIERLRAVTTEAAPADDEYTRALEAELVVAIDEAKRAIGAP